MSVRILPNIQPRPDCDLLCKLTKAEQQQVVISCQYCVGKLTLLRHSCIVDSRPTLLTVHPHATAARAGVLRVHCAPTHGCCTEILSNTACVPPSIEASSGTTNTRHHYQLPTTTATANCHCQPPLPTATSPPQHRSRRRCVIWCLPRTMLSTRSTWYGGIWW